MKRLNDRLHYRNFDASTVKMLYEMTSNDSIDIESDGVSHRALDDITYSLTLTKYIVEYFEKRGSIIDKLFEVVSWHTIIYMPYYVSP